MPKKRSATEILAEYAVSTCFESYPSDVTRRAKLVIIDTIGCMLGGAATRLGRSMLETLMASGESGTNTIVGERVRFGAASAALLNGTNANALDFDETLEGIGHPSASVIPAALAVGELRSCNGKALINGLCLNLCGGGAAFLPSTVLARLGRTWRV